MKSSLKLRKQKVKDRLRVKRLVAKGRLRIEQVALAANLPGLRNSRMILPELSVLNSEYGLGEQ